MSVRLPRTRKGKQKNNDHLFFFFTLVIHSHASRRHSPRPFIVCWVCWVCGEQREMLPLMSHWRDNITHTHTQKKKKGREAAFRWEFFFFWHEFPVSFLFGFFCVAYYWLLLVFFAFAELSSFFSLYFVFPPPRVPSFLCIVLLLFGTRRAG